MSGSAIPAAIKVGAFVVDVHVGGEAWLQAQVDYGDPPGGNLVGHYSATRLQIALADGLPPGVARETLLHEVIHAVSHATGSMIGSLGQVESDRLEEIVCSMYAGPLLAVFRDNPALVAYLLGSSP